MPKLIMSLDGAELREFTLSGSRMTIGRKPHNDIQIENLAVSGEHAALHSIQGEYYVEDLKSTNGTLVNGSPIEKHFLKHNDEIEIGKFRLRYVAEGAAAPVDSGSFDRTMVLRPGIKPADLPPPPPPPQAAPAPSPALPSGRISVLNGSNAGRELELNKNLVTLGKPGVQVAVISRRPQGFFLTHVEGASFPQVNGAAIGSQPHPLQPGDVIELAGVQMRFQQP
ncbi:FHA domain-containing protein [Leeia sp.]|uniref:FHA domain-containing protein n=1 Tax=Leeia sp. TaxID=2884678 RepID=UPI0035B4292F